MRECYFSIGIITANEKYIFREITCFISWYDYRFFTVHIIDTEM